IVSKVSYGLYIDANNNFIQGNYIGTNASGANLGSYDGIVCYGSNNTIGGTEAGERNVIAFNGRGIALGGANNQVRRNSIYANTTQGLQGNYPPPRLNGTSGTLTGATANTSFTIEFFSNDTCVEFYEQAKTFISDVTVMTDASGNASFSVPAGQDVTATASTPGLNTSSLSNCAGPIILNPTHLEFEATVVGSSTTPTPTPSPTPKTVTLRNGGSTTLNWQAAVTTGSGGDW